jgi:hypothetical protein
MRKTLVSGLNAMPKLSTITITNEDFKGIPPRVFNLQSIPGIDPMVNAMIGDPEVKAALVSSPDSHKLWSRRYYGYEAVLSVVPALNQTAIKVNRTIDCANTGARQHSIDR